MHQIRNSGNKGDNEKLELDWSHNEKNQNSNSQTGTDIEILKQTEQRNTQKHLDKGHTARLQGTDTETAGADCPRQVWVETIYQSPIF